MTRLARGIMAAGTGAVVAAGVVLSGAMVAPVAAPMATLAPCVSEDGSDVGQSFPCVWDAATRGNGRGASYVITDAPVSGEDAAAVVGAN